MGRDHIPGLRNDDVKEGVVLVAEACESNPENHFGRCVMLFSIGDARLFFRCSQLPSAKVLAE
jgi:hypothetical protein